MTRKTVYSIVVAGLFFFAGLGLGINSRPAPLVKVVEKPVPVEKVVEKEIIKEKIVPAVCPQPVKPKPVVKKKVVSYKHYKKAVYPPKESFQAP